MQPLFGLWADRLSTPVLLPAGVALGSIGIGVAGLCQSYALLMAVLLVSGVGIAAFHPEGARYASYVSRAGRGRGMSYFAVGGNVGFALGPALVTPVVAALGLSATPLLAIPELLVSGLLLAELRRLRIFTPAAPAPGAPVAALQAGDRWWPFSGAAGTLLGGWCADRYGPRRVLVGAMLPLIVLLALLSHVGLVAFFAFVVGVGVTVNAPFSTTIVLGQSYLPRRIALSSGITLQSGATL